MKILAILVLSILVLGVLFVHWANKPENVEALQKKRALEATQKIEEAKKQITVQKEQAVTQKEIETKKATMKLVIDENFANSRFEQLDFTYPTISYFTIKKNELNFLGMVYKGQNPQAYFISSKDEFSDFTAEMQVGIWGGDAYAGIFWGAQANGDKNPDQYQAAFSTPNTLYVEAGEDEDFGLGGLISSENKQVLRVERFGKHLLVSVNGRVLFNDDVASAKRGKIGLIIGHRGGLRPNVQSISIGINRFQVWQ